MHTILKDISSLNQQKMTYPFAAEARKEQKILQTPWSSCLSAGLSRHNENPTRIFSYIRNL